jgi:hypothetical protein
VKAASPGRASRTPDSRTRPAARQAPRVEIPARLVGGFVEAPPPAGQAGSCPGAAFGLGFGSALGTAFGIVFAGADIAGAVHTKSAASPARAQNSATFRNTHLARTVRQQSPTQRESDI